MDYYLISSKLLTVQYILKATCYTPLTHLKANTITTPPSATIRYDVDNNDDIKMDIRNPDDFSPHVVSTPNERNVSAGKHP